MSFRGFSAEPAVRGLGEGLIELLEPLHYVDQAQHLRIVVPKGFVSDGASVPPWAWWLLSGAADSWLELLAPGLLHDYLSRLLARIVVDGTERPVPSKRWAARTMAEAMLTRRGVNPSDAWKVRLAVALAPGYWQRRTVEWRPERIAT